MSRACALVVLASILPATAFAGPEVTPQAIIDHFTGAQTAGSGEPQRVRGLVLPDQTRGADRSVFIGAAGFGQETGGSEAPAGTDPADAGGDGSAAAHISGDPGAYDLLIEFDLDSAALGDEAQRHLDAFVEALHSPALADRRFLVEGHTDATGPAGYNLELSRRRAAAVVDYLVQRGIDPGRLTARGLGETRPRAADPENPANRRVETRLSQ